MSVSSVNNNNAALLSLLSKTIDTATNLAKVASGSPASPAGPAAPAPQANPLESLFQDGFTNGPSQSQGNQMDLLKSMAGLMDTLQQIQDLMAPEIGGDSPMDLGQGAGPGAAPEGLGGPGAGPGAGPTGGPGAAPQGLGGPQQAGPTGGPSATGGAEGGSKLGPGLPPQLEQHRAAIENASAKMGVPADMLAAQIWQESRGNLGATSTNGGNGLTDQGLMQVNPNTFGELKAKHPELNGMDLTSAEGNIMAGAAYMKDMKEQFGDWKTALRAYNSGPNGVDKSNLNALPAGTGDATYVDKVSQFWETIKSGNGSLPA